MEKEKAVVVLSGGMDSTTCLYRAIKDGYDVYPISFNYGQRHKKELEFAKLTVLELGLSDRYKVIDLPITDLLGGSALTDDIEVPHGHYEEENMKATVVPNRNMIMTSIASGYAVSLKAVKLYLGIHAGDHAIYPDCRPEFLEAMNKALEVANYEKVTVVAPYINDTKVEIIQDGKSMKVDYSKTWTCYEGKKLACGQCGSCQERLEAFTINNMEDPLDYETREPLPRS